MCVLLSQAWWLNRVWHGSVYAELLSKLCALPYAVHMEEIKVRHGATARNGALVLIRYVSVVTRRGHGTVFWQKVEARKFCGACWWSKCTFSKIYLGHFNCLWLLNILEVTRLYFIASVSLKTELGGCTLHLLVLKTNHILQNSLVVIYCMFLRYQSILLMWFCLVLCMNTEQEGW